MKEYAPTRSLSEDLWLTRPNVSMSVNQEEESEIPHKLTQASSIQSNEDDTPSDDSVPAPVAGHDHQGPQEEETPYRPLWTSFPTTTETIPSCIVEVERNMKCESTHLPELVFVVGVSGSGHHLIKALLSKVSAYKVDEFLPFLHIYEPGRDNDWSNLYYAIVEESLLRKRLQYLVDRLSAAQSEGKRGVVMVANSFPMGKGAGMQTTGRPDLISLNKFHCDLFRLKFVVIRRHPVSSVISTVIKYHDALTHHCDFKALLAHFPWISLNATTLPYMVKARILEGELMYIDQQIRRLGCHQMVFLDHDRIQDESTRKDQVQKLATFLHLNDSEIATVMSAEIDTPSEQTVAIPPTCTSCVEKTLYDFFEMRQMMWPLMAPQ